MKAGLTSHRHKATARRAEPHRVAHDLLISAANKSSRGASRALLSQFGIGLVEWRILRLLGGEGQTAATRICTELDLDKAAVSRSLTVLERLGAISRTADLRDGRTRVLGLTKAGVALHRRVVDVADRRERGLFKDFSAGDVAILTDLLARLQGNAVEMIRRDEAGAKPARAQAVSKPQD
jgi:DNA-binding MarR family transcriptional regulator